MKLIGKILQKAENPDESATIDVETEAGSRLSFALSREEARGNYAAGSEVTIEVTAKKAEVADEVSAEEALAPSAETAALMGDVPSKKGESITGSTPPSGETTKSGSSVGTGASKTQS